MRAPGDQKQRGTVDIGSKIGVIGIPDYFTHVKVVMNPSDATSSSKGNVHDRNFYSH